MSSIPSPYYHKLGYEQEFPGLARSDPTTSPHHPAQQQNESRNIVARYPVSIQRPPEQPPQFPNLSRNSPSPDYQVLEPHQQQYQIPENSGPPQNRSTPAPSIYQSIYDMAQNCYAPAQSLSRPQGHPNVFQIHPLSAPSFRKPGPQEVLLFMSQITNQTVGQQSDPQNEAEPNSHLPQKQQQVPTSSTTLTSSAIYHQPEPQQGVPGSSSMAQKALLGRQDKGHPHVSQTQAPSLLSLILNPYVPSSLQLHQPLVSQNNNPTLSPKIPVDPIWLTPEQQFLFRMGYEKAILDLASGHQGHEPPQGFGPIPKSAEPLSAYPIESGKARVTPNQKMIRMILNDSKRERRLFTNEKNEILMASFSKNQYISRKAKKELAASIGITEKQVKSWFHNRRTKLKKTCS